MRALQRSQKRYDYQRLCQQCKDSVFFLLHVPAKMRAVAAMGAWGDTRVVLAAVNPDA